MREKFVFAYMEAAQVFAQLSHCKRAKVGAIIVKDNRIISIGYNGMPSGWDNDCEEVIGQDEVGSLILKSKPEVLHAESNAIAKLAKSNESGNNATLFVTHSPCLDCAKLIYQSGITTVYFKDNYRSNDGIEFLRKSNVEVTKI